MKRSDLDTLTVLRTIAEGHIEALDKLCERFPGKVVIAAYEREVDAGLLDYGVSINYPWLTPEGERYLSQAEDDGCTSRSAATPDRTDSQE